MNKLIAPPDGYTAPIVEVLEIEVENGFAQSYGDEGNAGGSLGYNHYGDF